MPRSITSKPRLGLALLALSALPLSATFAHAQTREDNAPPARSAVFQSAFEGYQPHTSEKILDWKQANDHTARIGGWREYARQAQQPATATPTANAAADSHTAPAPDPHAAHIRQAKP